MKKLVLMILVAATFAFGQLDGAKQAARKSQAKVLTRAEIDELLSKPDQVLIIDVRRPDEVKDTQMREVFLCDLAGDRFDIASAGNEAGRIEPEAIAAMRARTQECHCVSGPAFHIRDFTVSFRQARFNRNGQPL
jgi:hypothetical protein